MLLTMMLVTKKEQAFVEGATAENLVAGVYDDGESSGLITITNGDLRNFHKLTQGDTAETATWKGMAIGDVLTLNLN